MVAYSGKRGAFGSRLLLYVEDVGRPRGAHPYAGEQCRHVVHRPYSPAHQILTSTIGNAAYQYASTATATTAYAPNGLNQYATVGSQAIVYDANGNLTNDGKYTYTYDPENRLITAAMTGMSASYLYDPDGRRHEKAVTGGAYAGTTQFLTPATTRLRTITPAARCCCGTFPAAASTSPSPS